MRLRWIVGGLGVAVLVTTVAHLPYYLGSGSGHGGGCPFGYTATREDAPVHHDARLRGDVVAKERIALAFTLGVTTKSEVAAYASTHGGSCRETRGQLECTNLEIDRGPRVTSAWFSFDRGRLDAIRTVRRDPSVETIAGTFATLEREVTEAAGVPIVATAAADTKDLARRPLRQAAFDYRFSNYRAVVRATNMGDGYALTEEYANLAD